MDRASGMRSWYGMSRSRHVRARDLRARIWKGARGWEIWSLTRGLRAFVLAVIIGYVAWTVLSAAFFQEHADDLVLYAALLACGAATVELTRRAGEPAGVIKDVYSVWELPTVILLPPLYALVMPAVRLALVQWRVRKAPVYRRVFSVAVLGLAYGCASAVFRGILPVGWAPRNYLWSHTAIWLLAAGACAVAQWAVSQVLVGIAAKASDADMSIRHDIFGREAVHNDVAELCTAVLVALGLAMSAWTMIVALPLTTMLQRAFRHNQLLHQARADAKTGLLNAAAWERMAVAEVERAVRTSSPLAVAVLDLDKFKGINDTYGHLLGDQVLRAIAGTMTEVLREYDLAGRFGGEEFVMLLPQTRAVDAFRIAERVREHISKLPVYADGSAGRERVRVTVSIGVAALDAGTRRELAELLAAADAALYRAKASGRDQVQMLSTSRGLSAVRPPADDGGAADDRAADDRVAGNRAADGGAADGAADDGAADGGADETLVSGAQLPEGAGLPEEAGSLTTATTSASAV